MRFLNPTVDPSVVQKLLEKIVAYEHKTLITDEVHEGKRFYTVPTGSVYPSVTTVLSAMSDKSWLQEWKDRVGEDVAHQITTQAAERGTSMHDLCYHHFKGDMPIDTSAIGNQLFNKLKIYLQNIIPLGLEVPLWSDRLRIAGRTDCIGYYKGHLSIIDYKTSRSEKTPNQILNYFQQSAFYSMMLLERLDIAAKKIVILIGVDSGFPQEFIRDANTYIKDNIRLVNDYHRMHTTG